MNPIHKPVPVFDDARRSPSPLFETEKTENWELGLRRRFIGDSDLPESQEPGVTNSQPASPLPGKGSVCRDEVVQPWGQRRVQLGTSQQRISQREKRHTPLPLEPRAS